MPSVANNFPEKEETRKKEKFGFANNSKWIAAMTIVFTGIVFVIGFICGLLINSKC